MYKLTVNGNHQTYSLTAKVGSRLSAVLRAHGLSPIQPCAGKGTCGKCRVIAQHAPVTDADRACLTPEAIIKGVRLCCQIVVNCDMEITLPEPDEPYTYKALTTASIPTGERPSGKTEMAADIGTTTIALALFHRDTGEVLSSVSARNPQYVFGADVMSRIAACVDEPDTLYSMRRSVWDCLASLSADLYQQARLQPESPLRMTVAGNTTMLHILAGVSPKGLACAPYHPSFLNSRTVEIAPANDLNIEAVLLPGISAFVGGDIVAAANACKLLEQKGTCILLDIGTNAEMLLCHEGKTYACSASAGPALEGGNITCGIPAVTGAVTGLSYVNGMLVPQVIGGGEPKGICGSGLVSVLASLLDLHLLSPNGTWNTSEEYEEYIWYEKGAPVFHLTDTVSITTGDVQAFLLAKSAVAAGIDVLLASAGLSYQNVNHFFLAGAFGANINLHSAVRTGLLPGELSDCIHPVGDAALEGAVYAALHPETLPKLELFSQCVNLIELSGTDAFSSAFLQHMMFP